MKVIERINLIEEIGSELQSRMTYSDIDIFLGAFNIETKGFEPSSNSKRIYVKELLADKNEELIIKIAGELELNHNYSIAPKEASFWKAGYLKLFLSHLSSFKVQTSRLQLALKKYGISSFVAHEDIEPSKEWQVEIEAGLQTMDALVAILMDGFKESNWCDQEIGVAVGRDVLIIPVRRGLDPYGFIGKYQAIQGKDKTVRDVAEAIFKTVVNSNKTRNKMLRALSNAIGQSTDIEETIEKIKILNSIEKVPIDLLENLKSLIQENSVLIESKEIIDHLNVLFSKYQIGKLQLGGYTEEYADDDIPF